MADDSIQILDVDSVSNNKRNQIVGQDFNTLMQAKTAWDALSSFRSKAKRNLRFTYGDQWLDKILVNGKAVTERSYMESKGKRPQQFNRIASAVNAVIGQYAQAPTEPVCSARVREKQHLSDVLTTTVQYAYQRNALREVDRNSLRDFLVFGVVCHRTGFSWDDSEDISDVSVHAVNHNRLFFDQYGEDFRHSDISLIGEIHDLDITDVLSQFGHTADRISRIKEIYSIAPDSIRGWISGRMNNLDGERLKNMDFLMPEQMDGRVRVIEVWKIEVKQRYKCHDKLSGEEFKIEVEDFPSLVAVNEARKAEQMAMGVLPEDMKLIDYTEFVDRFWYYRFLAPSGHVLAEGESPYEHKSHPYTIKVHPFINGEVHPFVSTLIEPQKYINRILTMQDFVQDSSAKGTLLVPEESISNYMTIQEMRDNWSDPNGVVIYRSSAMGAKPEQVIRHASQSGALDVFQVTNKLFDDIGGVSSALQGQRANANTPASLYAQQAQNSATMLSDILSGFLSFREQRDKKILRVQIQFYDEPRMINIVGDASMNATIYDPNEMKGTQFDLVISESAASPIARAMQNEVLLKLLEMGQIDAELLVEVGAFSFGDQLLLALKQKKLEQAQEQNEQMKRMQANQAEANQVPNEQIPIQQ